MLLRKSHIIKALRVFLERRDNQSKQECAAMNEALIFNYFGPKYAGRRYLRYAELVDIGVINNRGTLKNMIKRGEFPAGIRNGGPSGRCLCWDVTEIVPVLIARAAERGTIVQPGATISP
jgi:hypothetical protein